MRSSFFVMFKYFHKNHQNKFVSPDIGNPRGQTDRGFKKTKPGPDVCIICIFSTELNFQNLLSVLTKCKIPYALPF